VSDLLAAADEAAKSAYAPYSTFFVGAAARARDGRLFTGVNV
jgi:cytidine deaminase